MAISYNIIKREIALRTAQISGTSQASLESNYTGTWAGSLDGAEIPISSVRSVVIDIEAELHHIIGSDSVHPYRSYISGSSSPLANLADTPSLDASGNPLIGVFGSVVDGSTGQPLTLQPTQTIKDYLTLGYDEMYNYCIFDNTLQHTRTTAIINGCIFNRTTAETAYDASGSSPLPPILANTWIAGVMANLGQVGWTDGAGVIPGYSNLYQQGIQILRAGSTGQINLPLASQGNAAAG